MCQVLWENPQSKIFTRQWGQRWHPENVGRWVLDNRKKAYSTVPERKARRTSLHVIIFVGLIAVSGGVPG